MSWNGCLERKIDLSFVRAQAGMKGECSSHLREGEVRREGDIYVHRLWRFDGEGVAVENFEAVGLAGLALDFEAWNIDWGLTRVLGLEQTLDS